MLMAVASRAGAEDDARERETAKREFQAGTREFELGKFEEAIKHYEEAYRHRDNPVLLYNLAQAHRLAGHHTQALRLYRQYLARQTDAPNREEVSQKIALLEKLVENERVARSMPPEGAVRPGEQPPKATAPPGEEGQKPSEPANKVLPAPSGPEASHLAAPTPPEKPAPPPVPGRKLKIAGLVVAIVGVGALAGGIASGVLAQQQANAVVAEAKAHQRFQDSQDTTGLADQTAEAVLFAVGGAAVIGGAVLYYVGWRQGARERSRKLVFTPSIGLHSAGIALEGRF
jgi:tetratricopeptide (TPR) repeat protein